MVFRYARHTTDLKRIEKFYTELIGLEKLGSFQNHNNYDGIFLGLPDLDWHLEFTISPDKPICKFDEDDALVFYLNSELEFLEKGKEIANYNLRLEIPKNPYWVENGKMISDPDGYKIIFSIKHLEIKSNDPMTNLIRELNIKTWSELIDFIKKLPYGRNKNRDDLSLVVKERKGTCSSKHALLKKLADLNAIPNVKLILGMYKMNHLNTPKIGNAILESGLNYIPEAHCYLKLNNKRFDITTNNSHIDNLANDILEEIEIDPEQVSTFKIDFHKNYLKKWIKENAIDLSFEQLWKIREDCIKNLSK